MTEQSNIFPTIDLTIEGPQERLSGFMYWWLKSISNYDLSVHCARCLVGKYDRRVTKDMRTGHRTKLIGDLVYLCGVTRRWPMNFHAAAQLAPGETFSVETYNGFAVRFDNARRIDIEPLPDGWNGLPKAFTTCRNFQFAVQMKRDMAASTSA